MKISNNRKQQLDRIISGTDTVLGRLFDILLIFSILVSSLLLILDSVSSIKQTYGQLIFWSQNFFLILFTIEYILRVIIAPKKTAYIFSFYGIIDFLATAPVLISLFIPFGRYFAIIRILRLLRLFSVFKMGRYIYESHKLIQALKASRAKIMVFLATIVFIVVIVGALMHLIEGPQNGFINIPESMYWAVVTISTVGYGDISPQTPIGKLIASFLMLVGYAIIAVPTGIITSHIAIQTKDDNTTVSRITCPTCQSENHYKDAAYCHQCGYKL
jgi:voltage-gated potassium channel